MNDEKALSIDRINDVTVATMDAAEITPEAADLLMATVAEQSRREAAPVLVLDLSRIRFINSLALGWLVELRKRLKQHTGRLALVGIAGHCLNVLRVTGLEKAFDLYENVPAAIGALNAMA